MAAKLDAIDRKILAELQEDGRMTNAALAETLGLTATPTLQRVRKLEEAGIIQRYVALAPAGSVRTAWAAASASVRIIRFLRLRRLRTAL